MRIKTKSVKPIILSVSFLLFIFLFFKSLPVSSEYPGISEQSISFNKKLQLSPSDDAPDLKNKNGKWINTQKKITMEELKGKVVLIEFWTFGCYNCTNTLPYLNKWYEKYKSDEFEMIGVHCPEFDNERNYENVKASVEILGIKYPVLTDNEFSVWNEYDVHAWPTIFLIDKNGEIRYKKVGEGDYVKTEHTINELLDENYSENKSN